MVNKRSRILGGVFGVVVAMAVVTGCSSSQYDSADMTKAARATAAPQEETAGTYRGQAPLHDAARSGGAARNVIRQASLTVNVDELGKAEATVKQTVSELGGYIATENGLNLATDEPVLHLTIRIPEPKFDGLMAKVESLGRRTEKTVSSSDVTEAILDIQAQLNAKDKQFAPELLAQKEALMMRANLSTIELTLQQKANAGLSSMANSSWSSDTWNSAVTSALGAFRVLGAMLIWLLVYSPIWGIFAAAGWILYRNRRRLIASA